MLAQHGMYTYCIVSGVEGFWPDGQENDGARTAFPRPPSVRPDSREREESGSRICMHGSGHNQRRKKGGKDPPFSLRAILSSFHTAEGGREGWEGGGARRPGKEGQ